MTIRARFRLCIVGLVTLLLMGMMILTSCCDGGEPVVTDEQPPTVSITASPSAPEEGQQFTVTVSAQDASGVDTTAILEDGYLVQSCPGSSTCSYTAGPYSVGTHLEYEGWAVDKRGNEGSAFVSVSIWPSP